MIDVSEDVKDYAKLFDSIEEPSMEEIMAYKLRKEVRMTDELREILSWHQKEDCNNCGHLIYEEHFLYLYEKKGRNIRGDGDDMIRTDERVCKHIICPVCGELIKTYAYYKMDIMGDKCKWAEYWELERAAKATKHTLEYVKLAKYSPDKYLGEHVSSEEVLACYEAYKASKKSD